MKTNVRAATLRTHEGAPAKRISPEQELRRSLMACLLWENTFYESGQEISKRIADLVPQVPAHIVADLAVEARTVMKLRHAPLFLVREMARYDKHKKFVGVILPRVIQRADELAEFLSLYWKDGRQPISKQVKVGLAAAFLNFDEYAFAKYNRDNAIKLRDVMFMVHPKPETLSEALLFQQIAEGTLETPDTWEVALSSGANKKDTWIRLLYENKLGALALLRNLRNMQEVGVPAETIEEALKNMKVERVLPYRFIAAARYAPFLEPALEQAMFKCVAGIDKLLGKTVLLVDVSGSMDARISDKSEMTNIDAACGLAVLAQQMCENVSIYSFSGHTKAIPPRMGFALRDAIEKSQPHMSTELGAAVDYVNRTEKYDRLIVFTDEQAARIVPDPLGGRPGYMINVATYKNGVGYGAWTHIDGFSEATLTYIREVEKS